MKQLTYLGHAGWLFQNENIKCAFDPWSNKSGAFFDTWYPFPDNQNVNFQEALSDLDFVYISHAHEDHLVEDTLKLVSKDTKFLIANFKEKTTIQKLTDMGFTNIQELDSEQKISIGNAKIQIIKTEGFLENDSCILLEVDGVKILNLNDCHIDFQKIKNITQKVDILLLQSSNAIWWPCNYEYEEITKNNFGKIKRNNLLKRSLQYCEILSPSLVIPNAGPPIFKGAHMEKWNFNREKEWNPFCTSKEASEYFKRNNFNSDFTVPGETIFLKAQGPEIQKNNELRRVVYSDLEKYTKNYLKKIRSNGNHTLLSNDKKEIEKYFNKFKRQIKTLLKISNLFLKKIDFRILFEFSKRDKWIVDFQNEETPVQEYAAQEYRYRFKVNKSYFPLLMKEKNIDFERLFLSGDFLCKRDPDIFNEFLFTVLKNFDTKRFMTSEEIYAENSSVKDELFILEHLGSSYEVQKYCPHMYADLEEIGFINENNEFVCPLHGWKFDIKTGSCPRKKEKLKIKRIN